VSTSGEPYSGGRIHPFANRQGPHPPVYKQAGDTSTRVQTGRECIHPPGALSDGGSFRIHSVLVLTGYAVLNEKDKQYDETDERHQPDQQPQSAAAGVMQAPDRYGQRGNEDPQRIEHAQETGTAQKTFHDAYRRGNDDVEQSEHPVFGSSGAAGKDRIVSQYFQVPVHIPSMFFPGFGDVIY